MARPYGVLGRKLGHTYSPLIHRELAGLDYRVFEVEPDGLEAFVRGGSWEGLNVTIPYKRDVAALVDELAPEAERLGNVNTVTRLPDGRLMGDNTDYLGFKTLVESLGLELAGKRAVVFGGSGGAGTTARAVLEDLGMEAVGVGRTGEVTYADLPRLADVALAVNCTPAGMYPACPGAPCSLDTLPALEGLVDIVYNPARTDLVMEAERRGIPAAGGLLMLVAQAAEADARFTGAMPDAQAVRDLTARLSATEQNVALIGMPGSGKTRVGQALARLLGRGHVDIDQVLEERLGTSCARFIERAGEAAFRDRETEAMADVLKRSGLVVSCGGGAVVRAENYPLLHQNSLIALIDRPLVELASKGRPITARDGVERLAAERMPRYRAWADVTVTSRATPAKTARALAAQLPAMIEKGDAR